MNHQGKTRVNRYDLVTPMMPCKDEIMEKFEKFLVSGQYILGQEVRQLEQELAAECGAAEAVGVASGSSALFLALAMAGVQPGDEVITTAYTFEATIEAIILLGAVPVLVDINPTDLNIDLDKIASAITDKTRVILPVHVFGAPCDMNAIEALAAEHRLEVIVDMAQAFGTLYNGKPCAAFGRMNTLSFYPTKNLPGIGDGGMVFCRDTEDAERIRKIRGHGAVRINGHLYSGWNSRLDEVQAMVIRIRHSRFADEQQDRDKVAKIYDSFIPAANRLATVNNDRGSKVTHHQYWVRSSGRAELQTLLDSHGIDTGVYYDPPMNKHVLAEYCRIPFPLDEAERAGREILALPVHAALPFEDARRIGEIIGNHLSQTAASAES